MENVNQFQSEQEVLPMFSAEKFYNKFKADLIRAFNLSEEEANKQAEAIAGRFQAAFQN